MRPKFYEMFNTCLMILISIVLGGPSDDSIFCTCVSICPIHVSEAFCVLFNSRFQHVQLQHMLTAWWGSCVHVLVSYKKMTFYESCSFIFAVCHEHMRIGRKNVF